jgi:hypothetical protein
MPKLYMNEAYFITRILFCQENIYDQAYSKSIWQCIKRLVNYMYIASARKRASKKILKWATVKL